MLHELPEELPALDAKRRALAETWRELLLEDATEPANSMEAIAKVQDSPYGRALASYLPVGIFDIKPSGRIRWSLEGSDVAEPYRDYSTLWIAE